MQTIALYLVVWTVFFAGFIFLSTFIHELSHYLISKAVGFKIVGYNFWTIPFITTGYVDVRVKRNLPYVNFRKALMHASGLITHAVFVIIGIVLIYHFTTMLWRVVSGELVMVNLYLFILNMFPESSDGRKLINLIKSVS